MNEVTPGGKGGLPTRREFGQLLAAAAVLPAALPLLGEASPVAPPTGDYVPEDTYPYFTESDPAHLADQRHAEPGAAADRRGMLAFSDM